MRIQVCKITSSVQRFYHYKSLILVLLQRINQKYYTQIGNFFCLLCVPVTHKISSIAQYSFMWLDF